MARAVPRNDESSKQPTSPNPTTDPAHFRRKPPGAHHPAGSSEQPTSPKPTNRLCTSGVKHLVPIILPGRPNNQPVQPTNRSTDPAHFRCRPPGADHLAGSSEQPTSPKPTNRLRTSGVNHLVPCYTSRRVVRTTNQSKPNKPSSALPVGTTWCHATTNVNAKRDRQGSPAVHTKATRRRRDQTTGTALTTQFSISETSAGHKEARWPTEPGVEPLPQRAHAKLFATAKRQARFPCP
jgi:hypothetical protein